MGTVLQSGSAPSRLKTSWNPDFCHKLSDRLFGANNADHSDHKSLPRSALASRQSQIAPPEGQQSVMPSCRPETWTDVSRSDSEEEGAEVLDELGGHLVSPACLLLNVPTIGGEAEFY